MYIEAIHFNIHFLVSEGKVVMRTQFVVVGQGYPNHPVELYHLNMLVNEWHKQHLAYHSNHSNNRMKTTSMSDCVHSTSIWDGCFAITYSCDFDADEA